MLLPEIPRPPSPSPAANGIRAGTLSAWTDPEPFPPENASGPMRLCRKDRDDPFQMLLWSPMTTPFTG